MRWNTPGDGKCYGNLNAHSRQNKFVGFYSLIKHLLGMSLLEKVGKVQVDVLCVNWMLRLISILVWNAPSHRSVWLNIEDKLRIKNLWNGDSVINCTKTWCLNMEVKNIISLPIIVLWFI